jgi:hypothetical protein
MSATAPADRLSRTPRMPKTVWRCDQSLTLKANETKTLTLATGATLPANSIIFISLQAGKPAGKSVSADNLEARPTSQPAKFSQNPAIVALSFSTALPQRKAGG